MEKWRKHVTENNMTGYQLFANGSLSAPIFYYALEEKPTALKNSTVKPINPSIPRYVLIDRDQTILNNNAPRPSSAALTELLDGLVE